MSSCHVTFSADKINSNGHYNGFLEQYFFAYKKNQ